MLVKRYHLHILFLFFCCSAQQNNDLGEIHPEDKIFIDRIQSFMIELKECRSSNRDLNQAITVIEEKIVKNEDKIIIKIAQFQKSLTEDISNVNSTQLMILKEYAKMDEERAKEMMDKILLTLEAQSRIIDTQGKIIENVKFGG